MKFQIITLKNCLKTFNNMKIVKMIQNIAEKMVQLANYQTLPKNTI